MSKVCTRLLQTRALDVQTATMKLKMACQSRPSTHSEKFLPFLEKCLPFLKTFFEQPVCSMSQIIYVCRGLPLEMDMEKNRHVPERLVQAAGCVPFVAGLLA